MGIKELREINRKWGKMLYDDYVNEYLDYDTYWDYEPFTEAYWSQKHKIVFCNIEPYGNNEKKDKNNRRLTLEKLISLFKYNIPTYKFTTLFIYYLYNSLNGNKISYEQLSALNFRNEDIISVLNFITYMNLRKDENPNDTSEAEIDILRNYYEKGKSAYPHIKNHHICNEENRIYLREFIKALEPDIFIISHKWGYRILNNVYEIDIPWQGSYRYENMLFTSVYHPAIRESNEWKYQYIIDRSTKIIADYNKGITK